MTKLRMLIMAALLAALCSGCVGLSSRRPHDYQVAPCRILVSGQTAQHLGGRFPLVPVGSLTLRGRTEPLAVYRVEAPGGDE